RRGQGEGGHVHGGLRRPRRPAADRAVGGPVRVDRRPGNERHVRDHRHRRKGHPRGRPHRHADGAGLDPRLRKGPMTVTAPRGTEARPASAEQPAPRRRHRTWFPYLILLPAVILELLIHIVPMVTGFWMSFVELTKFFIRRWTEAPFVGLENYRIAVDFDTPIGQELLSSFLVTVAFTVLVVGLSWGLGMAAAVALQRPFRGRGMFRTLFLIPYALPLYAAVITWNFMLQRD